MRSALLVFALSLSACDYDGPPCEEVEHYDLVVDSSSGSPVFSWEGDPANDLVVRDPDGNSLWEVSCACKTHERDPDSNRGCRDRVDWDFRACLESPISYGELPDVETLHLDPELYLYDARPLHPGSAYVVEVRTYCDLDEPPWDEVASADFTAPSGAH